MLEIHEIQGFGDIETNKTFADLTTLKIGGPIQYVVYPHNEIQLVELLKYCSRNHIAYKLLGKGSDMLCGDDAYEGIVIKLDRYFCTVSIHRNEMIVEAGASIIYASMIAQQNGLSGLEFASGIPGTLGGALFMNAGAYKSSMQDVVSEVFVYHDGSADWLSVDQCEFSYRHSIFQKHPDWIILGAKLLLTPKDPTQILRTINDRKARRLASQPLEYPTCGSVFQNPDGQNAWSLIDQAGLRGKQIGGAQVSTKHCNFIINTGNATAKDYIQLVKLIQNEVYQKFQITLETEMEKFRVNE